MITRTQKRKFNASQAFEKTREGRSGDPRNEMTGDDKRAILKMLKQEDLIDIFKDFQRKSTRVKKGMPKDQRVSVTVTSRERVSLDMELGRIKSVGESMSMAQFIRNRALGSVDINGWREIAEKALVEIDDTLKNKKAIQSEILGLDELIEESPEEEIGSYLKKRGELKHKLSRLTAGGEKREHRLSGRVTMPESETIKWRAERLCISSSDYLRIMIFGLVPDSGADQHMSLDAKRRFYVSIVDVAVNGWGSPPKIYECSQCAEYLDEIGRLRKEIEILKNFD